MKKVIALALTLAMVLALGVTAFAADEEAALPVINVTDMTLGEEVSVIIANGVEGMTVKDSNGGYLEVTVPVKVEGTENTYSVIVKAVKLGITELVAVDKDGKDIAGTAVTVKVLPEEVKDPYEGTVVFEDVEYVNAQKNSATVIIPLAEGQKGVAYEVYNAATKLHPEAIVITGEGFALTLYRGDYTTATLNKDLYISVEVADTYKTYNNKVLSALGNNKADPYYVVVDAKNIDAVADKPELVVDLGGDDFDQWVKTNNSKAMDMYAFDAEDDSVAEVASNISVNNLFDNKLEMPEVASNVYVLVDADNSASSSANVKPNASTGANDMMAVAVVFATIALAAGVSKKVR